MTIQKQDKIIRQAIEQAWNRDSSETNMDRWLSVCKRENWKIKSENTELLAKVFGASWYFTRFIFFHGMEAVKYIDSIDISDLSEENILLRLKQIGIGDDLEENFEQLRVAKNEIMFRIFLAGLDGKLDQEQQELALTNLAECTLHCALDILDKSEFIHKSVSILAMGRMAGYEMNYGSDLDLIFLYSKASGDNQTLLIRQIQSLLRHIALPTPSGILYDIDMRLRPHGTSGTLISPVEYFIDYHKGQREVWERQMMTRCRPVIDTTGLATAAIDEIMPAIYDQHDRNKLQTEIIQMRKKVQQELGSPKGRYEVKRGYGGIMDIDFLTHYLQLLHGHQYRELHTTSTRNALRQFAKLGILDEEQTGFLLEGYNFLKKIEGVLRMRDLKSIGAFPREQTDPEIVALARAMGFCQEDSKTSATEFLAEYTRLTEQIRNCFINVIGSIE